MVDLSVSGGNLVLHVRGADKLWALKRSLEIPLPAHPTYNLTRPLCPYPQTAVYTGSGGADVFSAANWHCGGNLETPRTVCPNALVKYKHEVDGPIDYRQSGISPLECGEEHGRHHDGDHD